MFRVMVSFHNFMVFIYFSIYGIFIFFLLRRKVEGGGGMGAWFAASPIDAVPDFLSKNTNIYFQKNIFIVNIFVVK